MTVGEIISTLFFNEDYTIFGFIEDIHRVENNFYIRVSITTQDKQQSFSYRMDQENPEQFWEIWRSGTNADQNLIMSWLAPWIIEKFKTHE